MAAVAVRVVLTIAPGATVLAVGGSMRGGGVSPLPLTDLAAGEPPAVANAAPLVQGGNTVTISGRVLNGATPVANVTVAVACVTAGGSGCTFTAPSPTAADGSFTLTGSPARYDLFVRRAAATNVNSTTTRFVDATAGGTFSGIDVPVVNSTVTLNGNVTNAGTGSALNGATVTVRIPQQSSTMGATVAVSTGTSNAAGAYSLRAAPAPYTLRASRAGFR